MPSILLYLFFIIIIILYFFFTVKEIRGGVETAKRLAYLERARLAVSQTRNLPSMLTGIIVSLLKEAHILF